MYFFRGKNGIRDCNKNKCGMRDFREKGAGTRDQDPPSRPSSLSGHMSVCYMYFGRIKGYTECGVYGMCTEFVYLKENDPWISAAMKLVF